MAGLLDEYQIDLTEIEAPSFDVPDDIYDFVVGDLFLQKGTEKWPNRTWIIIQYNLGNQGKNKREWFELPEDASDLTEAEINKLGYYKARLMDLGIAPEDTNSVGPDDLIGLSGTLQVFTRNGYQNVKNVKASEASEPSEPEPAPVVKTPAARKAAPVTPAAEPAESPAPAVDKAAPAKKKNPFAPS